MSLYPGDMNTDDEIFAKSMAGTIENEMESIFENIKGTKLPLTGREDRKMLFVAISRGILRYLHDNPDFINSITLEDPNDNSVSTGSVIGMDLDITI
jgi:hypothetical protein